MPTVAQGLNHRFARKAGRVILWTAACFVLIQVIAGLVLDYVAPEIRFGAAAHVMALLRSRETCPDIVALGSSRLGLAFDAPASGQWLRQTLDAPCTVFNASMYAGDLLASDFLMQQILAEGCRPKVVLIEVLPVSISHYNEWLVHDVYRQLRWNDLPECLGDIARSQAVRPLLQSRLLPVFTFRQEILGASASWLQSNRQHEWQLEAGGPSRGTSDCQGLFGTTLARLRQTTRIEPHSPEQDLQQFRRWLARYHRGGVNAHALERLLQRCRQHDIHAILVGAPLASSLRGLHSSDVEFQFQKHVADLCRTYDCTWLDLRDQVPDSDFVDNQHVAPAGTQIVTREITEKALLPLLRRDPPGAR